MAEASGNRIMEGFLCPSCHKDLRAPKQLLAHFQEEHSEEQDILKSLKDLVGKAKKKILQLNEDEIQSFQTELSYPELKPVYEVQEQELGTVVSHTALLKDIRRERLDHQATETNKLVIRLDRLLKVEGNDRRIHEQNVVEWLDGSTVSRCPNCTKSFNITRRQHHCRLCGSIMCNSCTCFLPLDIAKSLVTAVFSETLQPLELTSETDSLRVCSHCMTMLENRRISQYNQIVEPHICKLYKQLQALKQKLQPSVDLYNKMYESLRMGETTFYLQDAQALRTTVGKQAEIIDTLSRKIAGLNNETHPKVLGLQIAIRRATSQYIKDYLLTLPNLPTPQEMDAIRKSRAAQHTQVQEAEAQVSRSKATEGVKKIAVTTGWSPAAANTRGYQKESVPEALPEDELLVMQMNNVREYIKQARAAQRFEEIVILQNNLKELKSQYLQIQQKYA